MTELWVLVSESSDMCMASIGRHWEKWQRTWLQSMYEAMGIKFCVEQNV